MPNLKATGICIVLALLGYAATLYFPYEFSARQAEVQANATVIAQWRTLEFSGARLLQADFADEIPKNAFLLRAMAKERLSLEDLKPEPGDTAERFQTRYHAQKDSRLRPLVEKWLERRGYLALCLDVKSRFREDAVAARAIAISELCGLMNEVSRESIAATSGKFRAILDRREIAPDVSESRPSFPIADAESLADALAQAIESILSHAVDAIHAAIQRMEPRGDRESCGECGERLESTCPACAARSRVRHPDGDNGRSQETQR